MTVDLVHVPQCIMSLLDGVCIALYAPGPLQSAACAAEAVSIMIMIIIWPSYSHSI